MHAFFSNHLLTLSNSENDIGFFFFNYILVDVKVINLINLISQFDVNIKTYFQVWMDDDEYVNIVLLSILVIIISKETHGVQTKI